MRLYVLRHAHSLSIAEAGVSGDAQRPISDQGRREIDGILAELAERKAAPAIIWTSPLKRAVQTAEEAAKKLRPALGVKVYEPLSNQISGQALFEDLLKEFRKLSPQNGDSARLEAMIVGHQPQLGEMVSQLCGAIVTLQPGGIVALDIGANGSTSIEWFRNP